MPRLLKTLTLAGLAYGLWVWLKGVLDEPPHPIGQDEPPAPSPEQKSEPAAESSSSATATSSNDGGATKAELYERAQELDIEGRSKMSKAELERAIRNAS